MRTHIYTTHIYTCDDGAGEVGVEHALEHRQLRVGFAVFNASYI
jgi:hypothetical protein